MSNTAQADARQLLRFERMSGQRNERSWRGELSRPSSSEGKAADQHTALRAFPAVPSAPSQRGSHGTQPTAAGCPHRARADRRRTDGPRRREAGRRVRRERAELTAAIRGEVRAPTDPPQPAHLSLEASSSSAMAAAGAGSGAAAGSAATDSATAAAPAITGPSLLCLPARRRRRLASSPPPTP